MNTKFGILAAAVVIGGGLLATDTASARDYRDYREYRYHHYYRNRPRVYVEPGYYDTYYRPYPYYGRYYYGPYYRPYPYVRPGVSIGFGFGL